MKTACCQRVIRNEIKMLFTLNKECVVHIYDFFEDPRHVYLFMDHFTCGDLSTVVRNASFDLRAVSVLIQRMLSHRFFLSCYLTYPSFHSVFPLNL